MAMGGIYNGRKEAGGMVALPKSGGTCVNICNIIV